MIYCLNCGKGIPDQSKFCTFCGTAIKQADTQHPEPTPPPVTQQPFGSPPAEQYVPPARPQQPEPTPPPVTHQPYVNPTSQQYVPPTPPPQQQYVHTPHPQQQYVNPAHPQQHVNVQRTATGIKNEFYKNIGFWGAVLIFVGFFLPYVSTIEASFYYLVTEFGADQPEIYLYLIFPISGAVLILQGLTGAIPKALVVLFKILPLLFLAYLGIGIANSQSSFVGFGNDAETILGNIGIGFYMIVLGSILVLFFRTTKARA